MISVKTHHDLLVWQKSMNLALMCYELTKGLPKSEQFEITSQIRRGATSVPANIAEGFGRYTRKSYIHFLAVANGSLQELETFLILAQRLGFYSTEAVRPTLEANHEVGRMLHSLRRALLAKNDKRGPDPSL